MAIEATYQWKAAILESQINHLSETETESSESGWWGRVRPHSLGWATAHAPGHGMDGVVGFVNVAWDGNRHAFLLDTAVLPSLRRHGIATQLVRFAAQQAATTGCEWLHVDFEAHLAGFYLGACGFQATQAGLVRLSNG